LLENQFAGSEVITVVRSTVESHLM
jgi:hypothetical protein